LLIAYRLPLPASKLPCHSSILKISITPDISATCKTAKDLRAKGAKMDNEHSDREMDGGSSISDGDNTASRLLQAFGKSQGRPLTIDSDSHPDQSEQENDGTFKDTDAEIRRSSEEDTSRLLHIELPILSLKDKEEYQPLLGSSIVHRVLRQIHNEEGVRYNILFYDGHKETVWKHLLPNHCSQIWKRSLLLPRGLP
jgi:hypothetical protein